MTSQATSEQQADDLAVIRRWYEGDAERMRSSLHPELAKRAIPRDPQTGDQRFHHVSQQQIVDKTQQGGGSDTPSDKRFYDVTILDIYDEMACARAESYEYVDYLHLARWEGAWVIVNVLFTYKRIES